ncbi:MAG: hypothetical protein H0V29_07195 [Thermoleophilaceae bacterium]|nr:hypothetical protein [Thermoleophilaceae bacterium]
MDEQRAKELLARERARIEKQLVELKPGHDDELSNLDQHDADSATDLFEDERDAGTSTELRSELDAIGRAEERLAAGKYGLSVESGEPIPDARLEVVPWAERTVPEEERRR